MAHGEKTHVRMLQKRGSGLCVVVPSALIEALGWNRDDALRLAAVNGSLIVTRIDLPKIPELRAATSEVGNEQ